MVSEIEFRDLLFLFYITILSGPTIYVPIIFRLRAQSIYSADLADSNCEMLKAWSEDKASFVWKKICEWISNIENYDENPRQMQRIARRKLRAIFKVI